MLISCFSLLFDQKELAEFVFFCYVFYFWGRRMIGVSGSQLWSKTLMALPFNHSGEFRWSSEGPVCQIYSPHLHAGASEIYSDLLRSVQMLKREWGAESNGKIPHLSIPSKTAVWVPEFAVEDQPLSRIVLLEINDNMSKCKFTRQSFTNLALVPEFTVKDLSLGRILWWWRLYFY